MLEADTTPSVLYPLPEYTWRQIAKVLRYPDQGGGYDTVAFAEVKTIDETSTDLKPARRFRLSMPQNCQRIPN
jgi:hypothetical protein